MTDPGSLDQGRVAVLLEIGGEELLAQLVGDLAAEETVLSITKAIESGDLKRAALLAHRLKGGARNVGATDLGLAAEAVENEAKAERPALLAARVSELGRAARVALQLFRDRLES